MPNPPRTLFFLNPENEVDEEDKPKTKKTPVKPLVNGSPVKKETFGGKVLWNRTRGAAQEEVLMTAAARIKEHQQQLHEGLQTAGLAKYSEGGVAVVRGRAKRGSASRVIRVKLRCRVSRKYSSE